MLQKRWLHMLFAAALYLVLLLPAVNRQGISWDEQTDIVIARAYLDQPNVWLEDSPIDPSQTRLPHFTVALVYQILRTSDLLTARLVSVLVGLATLVWVYVYCLRRFTYTLAFWLADCWLPASFTYPLRGLHLPKRIFTWPAAWYGCWFFSNDCRNTQQLVEPPWGF